MRDKRPINANVLCNDFLANRVCTRLATTRKGLFAPGTKANEAKTVLLMDGQPTYALRHSEGAGSHRRVRRNRTGESWRSSLRTGRRIVEAASARHFFVHDPRMGGGADAAQVTALGA